MKEKICTVELTRNELERIIAIIAYNLDANLVPDMQEHAKLGNIETVLNRADVIKADRELNQKLLNAL